MTLNVDQQVLEFCERNSLLKQDDSIVVGVSGGFDSLCLLHLLKTFSDRLTLNLTVAHLNHQLRDHAADLDERFVRETAKGWGLPIAVERQPVAQIAAQRRQSIEETARQLRYNFLWRVARQVGAHKVAVGHNADDQVETVLMHFLRGTGLSGLRGMLPATSMGHLRPGEDTISGEAGTVPSLIRPLLDTPRADIEAYCRAHQLIPREDQSNADITFFRNRLRHELIPYLESYNPNIRQVLRRTAKVAAADLELLNEQAAQAWQLVLEESAPDRIVLDLPGWLSLPLALKRATLRRAWQTLRRSLRDISFEHIEQAVAVVETGGAGAKATLPGGVMLSVSYRSFTIAGEDAVEPEAGTPALAQDQVLQVVVPGTTRLPGTGWQLRADLLEAAAMPEPPPVDQAGPWEAYLDADLVGGALILRTRRPGDSFRPFGLAGHSQKVKEFMINKKIPAARRAFIPLLVTDDEIVWVCGYQVGEQARIRPTTQRILHLQFVPV